MDKYVWIGLKEGKHKEYPVGLVDQEVPEHALMIVREHEQLLNIVPRFVLRIVQAISHALSCPLG